MKRLMNKNVNINYELWFIQINYMYMSWVRFGSLWVRFGSLFP